jgi:hypothetical protein
LLAAALRRTCRSTRWRTCDADGGVARRPVRKNRVKLTQRTAAR